MELIVYFSKNSGCKRVPNFFSDLLDRIFSIFTKIHSHQKVRIISRIHIFHMDILDMKLFQGYWFEVAEFFWSIQPVKGIFHPQKRWQHFFSALDPDLQNFI